MYVLLVVGICSFVLCFALTPLVRNLFLWWGKVDVPDQQRKLHARAVPRIGGIPIVISCIGSFVLLNLLLGRQGHLYIRHEDVLRAVVPASSIIFLVGLLDDLFGLKPWQKLAGQIVAASLALCFGVHPASTHLPAVVVFGGSLVWLICCTNAVNLIDGIDGLASGVSLLITLSALVVALIYGRYGLALATAPLAGALLAFLRYNFSPASVFLGDCGSLTIGFMLGCFGLVWSQHTVTQLGIAAPLMALALPLTDVGLAVVRRFLRNAPLFEGDRGHIHHRILALGFSASRATLILYGVCCANVILALGVSLNQWRLDWLMLVLFVVLLFAGISRLGYVEFSAVRKLLSRLSLRRAVQEEIHLHELRTAMVDVQSVEGCWQAVRTACRELRFVSARLNVGGASFFEEFLEVSDGSSCDIELTLGNQSWLFLRHSSDESSAPVTISVLNQLQSMTRSKLQELQPGPMPVCVSSTAA